MSSRLIAGIAMTAILLAPLTLWGATETDKVTASGVCRWISDPEAPSTSSIEAAVSGEEQSPCTEALDCLLRARENDGSPPSKGADSAAAGEAGQTSLEAACRQLEEVLALPKPRIEEMLGEVTDAPHVVDGQAMPEACTEFLGCLLGLEQTPWKEEFELICSKVPISPNLTEPELHSLLRRCSALQERIEGLDLPEAKVYLFRLEKCRSFFEYAIELQQVWREERGRPAAG